MFVRSMKTSIRMLPFRQHPNVSIYYRAFSAGIPDDPTVSHAESIARRVRALQEMPPPKGGSAVDVRAYYMARSVDITRLHNKDNIYAKYPQNYDSGCLTITINGTTNEYLSIFDYGSVVLFNVPQASHKEHLDRIKQQAGITPLGKKDTMMTDSYRLMIHPDLEGLPSVVKAAHLNIKKLDANNITIVATVMAQSVSLDYYADAVDNMLESFMNMNLKVERTGGNAINALDKQQLYRLVASNNTVITNVLLRLGIFEGSDAAWDNADYHYTLEALRTDFELDHRYKDLSLKLDLVKDNARFFLDILNSEKGEKLEWIIIILIGVEIVLGLAGLYLDHYDKNLDKEGELRLWDQLEEARIRNRRQALDQAAPALGASGH